MSSLQIIQSLVTRLHADSVTDFSLIERTFELRVEI